MIPVVQVLTGLLEEEKEEIQKGKREDRHSLHRDSDGETELLTLSIMKARAGRSGGAGGFV